MASTGVNVLRWGSLVFGVFYGFSHQSQISSREKQQHAQHEYERKSKLIDQAKAEWAKKTAPKGSKTEGGDIISDPMDPKFDLEKYLMQVQGQNA